jgi:transcriptional regulator with XRE-family HTH domain
MNGIVILSQGEIAAFSNLKDEGGQAAALAAFVSYKGLSKVKLAGVLGVSQSMASKIVTGREVPKGRVAQLAALGIPEFLLPPAGYVSRDDAEVKAA